MAELADAPDLGSGGETRAGSSPVIRIKELSGLCALEAFCFGGYQYEKRRKDKCHAGAGGKEDPL